MIQAQGKYQDEGQAEVQNGQDENGRGFKTNDRKKSVFRTIN